MSKFFSILFFLCMWNQVMGQSDEIIARGKVIDTATGKGVRANIRYSSIPTGSISGRFNDSTYSFSIFGSAKYRVTAESTGYNPKTIIVDPKEVGADHLWLKDIGLTPKGQSIRLDHLIFEQGKATIDPGSFRELDEIAEMMLDNTNIRIQLEGHTDNTGNPKANFNLSEDRVEAVKRYLVSKGISKKRIKTKAFGGTQPLRNEMTPEARAMNRRVEMRILDE